MGKCTTFIAYVLGAIVFMALGALIAGLSVYYTREDCPSTYTPKAEIHAECALEASSDGPGVTGYIFFHQMEGSPTVTVEGNVTGIAPGPHGFHIHTYGVIGGECGPAEGHYNPDGFDHAAPTSPQRHVGDLGNIESVDDGTGSGIAYVTIVDDVIQLYGENSIVGRSVVVHEGEDDLGLGGDQGSITTGNAGARLACCTIFLTSH
ncbi:cysteine desulfurase Selenocysteine lyase [Halocaridina rubra]|uniref:Superoxide dismutase [Cu-Zn] n=1 Tax=Halocaridina rubra TaxID=373956 RepID=A0AAN8WHF5_HALRR